MFCFFRLFWPGLRASWSNNRAWSWATFLKPSLKSGPTGSSDGRPPFWFLVAWWSAARENPPHAVPWHVDPSYGHCCSVKCSYWAELHLWMAAAKPPLTSWRSIIKSSWGRVTRPAITAVNTNYSTAHRHLQTSRGRCSLMFLKRLADICISFFCQLSACQKKLCPDLVWVLGRTSRLSCCEALWRWRGSSTSGPDQSPHRLDGLRWVKSHRTAPLPRCQLERPSVRLIRAVGGGGGFLTAACYADPLLLCRETNLPAQPASSRHCRWVCLRQQAADRSSAEAAGPRCFYSCSPIHHC